MARNIFIEQNQIEENDKIKLTGEEFNHLINVLRYKENDEIIVCNNSGYKYLSKIISIAKKEAVLQVLEKQESKQEPKFQIDVFQALVKGEKFELLAQKLTEIGVSSIIPFSSEFCQVKPNTTRLDRLNKISVEACKQCGRAKSLEISKILSFDEMIDSLSCYEKVFFAYEKEVELLKIEPLKYNKIALIIGSEGGFSDNESQKIASLKNVQTISLGNRILRAETASIVLSSTLMFLSTKERE